jgi:hypothetical protein
MTNLTVCVEVEIKDGRSHIQIKKSPSDDLTIEDLGKILAGGLALTIRASDNEAKFMGEIIDYLQREFVDHESFNDVKKNI